MTKMHGTFLLSGALKNTQSCEKLKPTGPKQHAASQFIEKLRVSQMGFKTSLKKVLGTPVKLPLDPLMKTP